VFDDLIEDIAKLHTEIHSNEPRPANELEQQAAHIFSGTQRTLLELINDNVGIRTLELSLLYNWLRLAALNRGYDEKHFDKFAADLGMVIERLVGEMKALDAELDDEGPTTPMASIGMKIQQLRNLFGEIDETHLPREEIARQTAKATAALFGFTAECLQKQMHPGLLESSMLYHWLRSSTVMANVEESVFQKLERHWPTVVKRVGKMTDKMLKGQYGFRE